jgi:hypothetical protein
MNKKGISIPAKMKIVLSRISGSVDDIKEFMEKVDADVSRLSSNAVTSTVSTLGQVLELTKTIMDKLTKVRHSMPVDLHSKSADRGDQAHPILDASWTIVSSLYQVNCPTKCQVN